MPKWLKLTTGLVLTLLMAALGAAAFAPLLMDKQQVLTDLETEISLALGRPTQIESIGLLQLLPIPRLRVEGVQIAESAATDASILATVDALQLDAAVWPLVTGRLVLAEVLIDRPKISLPLGSPASAATAATATETVGLARPTTASWSHFLVADSPRPSVPGESTDTMSDGPATGAVRPGVANDQSTLEPAAEGGIKPDVEVDAEPEAKAEAGGDAPESAAYPPTLPPIRRLIILNGELSGPAEPAGPSARFSLGMLNLTAGPIIAGRSGRLDATFRLFAPALFTKVSQAGAPATNTGDPGSLGTGTTGSSTSGSNTSSTEPARFSLPGLAEAEIKLGDPLTEVALRPLRLRFGSSAGGQGPPIEIDAEILIEIMTGRVAIEPFELIVDRLRIDGMGQLFPTSLGLGVDGQLQVPAFDLRTWLIDQAALTMPGTTHSLRRVGGQFDVQLRGPVVAIDNAALIIDQARASAAARLHVPQTQTQTQTPPAPITGQLAFAVDRLDLDPYLLGAEAVAASDRFGNAGSTMPPLLPPLPPLPPPPETSGTERGLRFQLAVGELRLGGLNLSSVQLEGHLLQDALELDSNADFYDGWLETRFSATRLDSSVADPWAESQPGAASEAGLASATGLGPAPVPKPASVPQSANPQFPAPELRLEATAAGVDVAALLADVQPGAGKQPPITGLGEIDLTLNARGADPASIIPTLGGEAAFAVRNGAVTMVDLGQLITGTIGAIGVSREDAENLTRFSALSLSAKGKEGQFSSDDIQLRSNLLDIDGNGKLDLTTLQIALELQAVLTKPPKGRGIKELEGIPIPISAEGPWADPRWEVDVRTALDNAARRALREDSGLIDEIEERTGIKGLGDGLRQILPGLLGR